FAEHGQKEYFKDPAAFRSRAVQQWHALKSTLEAHGAANCVLRARPGDSPDAVFTADGSIWLQTTHQKGHLVSVFSRFTNAERQRKVNAHIKVCQAVDQKPNIAYFDEQVMEGRGDHLYDPFRDLH